MRDGKIILKKKKVRHKILFFILFLIITIMVSATINVALLTIIYIMWTNKE